METSHPSIYWSENSSYESYIDQYLFTDEVNFEISFAGTLLGFQIDGAK